MFLTPGTAPIVSGAGTTGLATALLPTRSGTRVAVLEARFVGAGTAGATTAKLTLHRTTVLSDLRRQRSQKLVNASVEANREGQSRLLATTRKEPADNDKP